MRSFSFLPSRLILVHPLQSPLPFRLIPVSPSSHIPLYHSVSRHPRQPSSYTPLCLSVPHHPRQPSSHTPFCLSVPHHPRQPLQSHALLPFRPTSSSSTPPVTCPFTFPSHVIPVSPPVTRPCTFPSHIILVNPSSHMPFYLFISFNISSHLCVFSPPCPRPLGKVPGFSTKTVHFPPWHETSGEVQQSLLGKVPSIQAL